MNPMTSEELLLRSALAARRLVEEEIRRLDEWEARKVAEVERTTEELLASLPPELLKVSVDSLAQANWDIQLVLAHDKENRAQLNVEEVRKSLASAQNAWKLETKRKELGDSVLSQSSVKLRKIKGVDRYLQRGQLKESRAQANTWK